MAGTDGTVRRQDNWHVPLREEIAKSSGMPFSWGRNDCVQFVFRCVKAQTGTDIGKGTGKYRGERSAMKALVKYGGKTIDEGFDILAEKYGMKKAGKLLLKRGDPVCFYDDEENLCMGVVDLDGAHAVFLTKDSGAVKVPTSRCYRGWSIG